MLNEVHAMQSEGISEKELRDQLKVMITRDLMGQQTNASQAAELCRYELVGGTWENAEHVVNRMRRVTRDDVQRMCAKYIKNIDFVMLGDPEKWKDPLTADRSAPGDVDLK
jgi:predicted Zn-dependent peptidase